MVSALDRSRVLALRMATQRLSSAPLATAADVVELLTCVQSQERDHAFYSLAMRSRRSTYAAVRREHDAGAFLRTHILRPTWHFVRPQDLRWILELTSPRVLAGMAGRHRQLGLDEPGLVDTVIGQTAELLRGRHYRTRAEIGTELTRLGSPVGPGERLGHLLLVAELRGVICSGPMQGPHHTYALVDEVVAPTPTRDRAEALVELARRFFTGHGPATVKDFTRWSSLTATDTRTALAELGDDLEQVEVEGQAHWYDPEAVPRRSPAAPTAYLFPTYDEVVLTYPTVGFPAAPDHPYAVRPDPFWAMVLSDGENVGLWKRTVAAGSVEVDVRLAPSLPRARRTSVRVAAQRLAAFLERDLAYAENKGTPPPWRG
ncbi:winged helix DNA-binding domain-containing protein [Pedococcus sp. NPDC057267]|uniref:winged helix DNA-binding domain-containing protein n=1 Tax=Pedococcus sp. NPDC057267 TaxID=3346077 RepID=UPI003625DC1D